MIITNLENTRKLLESTRNQDSKTDDLNRQESAFSIRESATRNTTEFGR